MGISLCTSYPKSGTNIERGGIGLRKPYAKSGTDIPSACAMSGTDKAHVAISLRYVLYRPTSVLCEVRYWHGVWCHLLRAPYAISGTDTTYGHASAYVRAMRSPVLTSRMLLLPDGSLMRVSSPAPSYALAMRCPVLTYPMPHVLCQCSVLM
eukprot:2140782-Rhodomonas_salina.5